MNKSRNHAEFEHDFSFSDEMYRKGFRGITHAYGLKAHERHDVVYAYELVPIETTRKNPRETRAYREMRRHSGKNVPKIDRDALHDELFIVPGAGMSPADVVKVLRDFIAEVEEHGMFIGKYGDAFIRERISGEPRFDAE
jgi:hypothetical protein